MSTTYFLLSKKRGENVTNTEYSAIIQPPPEVTYLLPRNLLSCYANDGLFESGLIEWCKQFCKSDGIFLDIGAHTGTYTLSLSSYVNHVYAFEPQKMTYYALCGGVALSDMKNVTCINHGLGSSEQVGKTVLNIVSRDGGGSTIHTPSTEILCQEEITITTLDSYKLSNVCFIKMDVEENELFVLQGAKETLIRCGLPCILFESNDPDKRSDLFSHIEDMSYRIVNVTGAKNMFLACR